jgi:hypothetical protein
MDCELCLEEFNN